MSFENDVITSKFSLEVQFFKELICAIDVGSCTISNYWSYVSIFKQNKELRMHLDNLNEVIKN